MEKQKYHHFKRFFLISSLLLAVSLPFVKIPWGTKMIALTNDSAEISKEISLANEAKSIDVFQILEYAYLLIALLLLIKLSVKIISILKVRNQSKLIKDGKYTIALLHDKNDTFSFLNTIFLNKIQFENNKIDDRILMHEKTHIDQKHSLDIIFIEILKAIFWLNPALYFYRKAIETNHEFLADDEVLKSQDLIEYQTLIVEQIVNNPYSISQTFKNNNNTKKRFIMMHTTKNKKSAVKIYSSILFSGIVIFAFAEKVETPVFVQNQTKTMVQSNLKNLQPAIAKEQIKTIIKTEKEAIFNHIEELKIADTIKKEKTNVAKSNGNNQNSSVDIPAEFPGGINALRQALAEVFDTSKFDNTYGKMTTSAELRIDSEGKLIDVKTTGLNPIFNSEAQKAIQKIMSNTKWIPAQKDGKAVNSYYKIPFTMEFTGNGTPPPPPPPPAPARKHK